MTKETLKLKIARESDIDSILKVLTDNDYKVSRTREVTEKFGGIEIKSYFVIGEK